MTTPSPKSSSQLQTLPVTRQKCASPWRAVRFSPYLPRNPLAPSPSLSFNPAPNPLYQGPPSYSSTHNTSSQRPEKVTNLQLSYTLLRKGVPRDPTREELLELRKIFPTLKSVSYQHPFLVLVVEDLPPQPWPVTLAGLPLWLTKDENDPPIILDSFARANRQSSINGTITAYEFPSEKTVLEIFDLLNNKGAEVDAIEFDGLVFRAFSTKQPPHKWQDLFPSSVNGFTISYVWQPAHMEERAMRLKVPDVDVTDDTRYPINELRPGIMVSGIDRDGVSIKSTTSGVCVRSPRTGQRFITLAAHGFPAHGGDFVYHPQPHLDQNGELDESYKIGTIERKFGDTDIALARLEPGIRYSRETFSVLEPDQPEARAFRNLKDPSDGGMRMMDPIFMNTPFNGQCEGRHLRMKWALRFGATDTDPEESTKNCEIAVFSYWGNGSEVFLDGSCGGVIWDENFDVLSQFGFQEKEGQRLAYSPTFKVLVEHGYQLSTI